MDSALLLLAGTAGAVGFIHTLVGPDHYLPFIVLAKARKWSALKTAVITALCGLGHVLSSVVLGLAGIALGAAVFKLEKIESLRGDFVGWLFLIFGFTYFIWGLHRAYSMKAHLHEHAHEDGSLHSHAHIHAGSADRKNMTPWLLFIIFVFGPCEPLIPLVMYPAATKQGFFSVFVVAGVFALATIGTMLAIVLMAVAGLSKLPLDKLERYSHALAGLAVLICGIAIKAFGL